uniref:Putative protease n=1 Tax=viral metagenome TaxID=1070528 RepID=A0A6M3ISR0_9ZZZZ
MRISNRSLFKPKTKSPYGIKNKASADESTVYIYDEISWFGIDAEQFIKDFQAIKSSTIHIRINSPGGAVFDGTAIYNVIKQSKAYTISHIDGLAASISSVISLASKEVRMADNAFMMIHEPFSLVIGTAQDMRNEADLLDKVTGTIAKTYVQKSGKDETEIKDMMAAETWMTAQEALDNGFIDKIEEDDKKEDKSSAVMFDLSAYANVPAALKERKEAFSARDIEKILRDGGVPVRQAKAILSEGFKEESKATTSFHENLQDQKPSNLSPRDDKKELRDVAPSARDLRDVDTQAIESVADVLRDVEQEQEEAKEKDKVADLLERAELIAPSIKKPEPASNQSPYILFQ